MQGYTCGSVGLFLKFILVIYTFLTNNTQFEMNKIWGLPDAALTPCRRVKIRVSNKPISPCFSLKKDALIFIETLLYLYQPADYLVPECSFLPNCK